MSGSDYYNHTTFPSANSAGVSQSMRNELESIEAGFDKLPALGAGVAGKPVAMKADGTGMEAIDTFTDTTAGNVSTGAHGLVPKLPGSALVFLRGDGSWSAPGGGSAMNYVARTSNTQFTSIISGTLVDITSGTFTQTFDPVATLANGWFIFLRNSGTGDITLDPSGAELIDGLASYIMYPGEVRIIQCDGTKLTSYVIAPFTKDFAASGNFIKPPGYIGFDVEQWGGAGGGAGGSTAASGGGGGGGGYYAGKVLASQLSASTAVTIGAGGTGGIGTTTSTVTNGVAGGASSFGTLITVNGGAAGVAGAASGGSGGGIAAAPYLGGAGGAGTSSGASNGSDTAVAGAGGGSGGANTTGSQAGGNGGARMGRTAAVGNPSGVGPAGLPFCGGAGGAYVSGTAFAGGNGGIAGGGGGGGRSTAAVLGGNGGNGGAGYCTIRGI